MSRKLGPDACSPQPPTRRRCAARLEETRRLALELGAPHEVIRTDELANGCFAENPTDRCFHCKQELFAALQLWRSAMGFEHVVYGATRDDLGDYRPGLRAAERAGAGLPCSPRLPKQDVRDVSAHLGLRTAYKPAMACLASRIPVWHAGSRRRIWRRWSRPKTR